VTYNVVKDSGSFQGHWIS